MSATPRRVLVTGATGGLGRAVMRALASDPRFEAVGWTRSDCGDIADFEHVTSVLARIQPDAIIHLAGVTGPRAERDPRRTQLVNVDATEHLARAAAQAGARRLVFASSATVYGSNATTPLNEAAPLEGTLVYARSKIQAERALAKVADETGLEVISLRIFNVYGDDFPQSLITRLRQATPESDIVLAGGASFVRDYIHGDDVARVFHQALLNGMPSKYLVVNVGSGTPTTNEHLFELLSPEVREHVTLQPRPPSYSVADITLCASLWGRPSRDVRDEF